MAALTVAHLAPIMCPVPVVGYGAIERVVEEMLAVQSATPTRVRLYASGDSTLDQHLPQLELRRTISSLASVTGSGGDHPFWGWAIHDPYAVAELDRLFLRLNFRHYVGALRDADDVDVVHAHGMWVLAYARFARRPLVVSLYDNTALPDVQRRLELASDVLVVANSPSTRDNCPNANWIGTVLEGVVPERYPFSAEKGDYFIFIGRVTRDKGCHTAIRVARALSRRLLIVGPVVREGRYFREEILPEVDGDQIQYLGEMGAERLDLLKGAAALLSPIEWEEPFGRILAEAAACGTPTITYRRGAASHVVAHGRTGFVAGTFAEFLAYCRQVHTISPRECRRHAETRLSSVRAVAEYDAVYRKAIARVNGQPADVDETQDPSPIGAGWGTGLDPRRGD